MCNMIQCKVKRQPPGSCTNAMPLCPGGCIPNHVDEDVLKEVRNGFTFVCHKIQKTMSCRNVRSRVPSRNFSTCRRDTVVTRRNSGWSELKRVDVSATVSLQDQVGTDRGWAFVTYEVRVYVTYCLCAVSHGDSHSWKSQFLTQTINVRYLVVFSI